MNSININLYNYCNNSIILHNHTWYVYCKDTIWDDP